jgi:hypothetical protein
MVNWFTSTKGALVLSTIGLLTFVAYAFLVSRYVLEDLAPGVAFAALETVVVLAIVGAWVWGLLSAAGGAPSGWTALLVCSLLPALFTLYDLSFYSPIKAGWPLLQAVVVLTFVACAAASAAVIVQLRQG